MLDPARNAELRERRVERRSPAVDGVADDGEILRRGTAAQKCRDVARDELDRAARPGPFEKPKRPIERRPWRAVVGEQLALEMCERRGRHRDGGRRPRFDPPACERSEILDRTSERGEGSASRLVRDGERHVGACGQGLDEPPLRPCQVLEAVREKRLPAPGVEVAAQALDGVASHAVPISDAELSELGAIRVDECRELSVDTVRIDEPRLELPDRVQQRVCEPCRRSRLPKSFEVVSGYRPSDGERTLCLRRDGKGFVGATRDLPKEVVERPDRSREERRPPADQVTLDPVDVHPVRDDEPGIALEHVEIALQKQRHLADVRRSDDERDPHRSIVVLASGTPSYALRKERASCTVQTGICVAADSGREHP